MNRYTIFQFHFYNTKKALRDLKQGLVIYQLMILIKYLERIGQNKPHAYNLNDDPFDHYHSLGF